MRTRILFTAAWVCVAAAAVTTTHGQQVKTTTLSTASSDFALDPQTGNVGAVDPKQNLVLIYKIGDVATGKPLEPLHRATAGNVPSSIVFKQVGEKRYYVVGCLKEANIYVFNADDLKQVAKIPVGGSDIAGLAASRSSADPYVFYNFGRGHDSQAGGVNLVTLTDEGQMFDDSMDCAISAHGSYAYRRGPWSPSGFESLRRVAAPTPGGKPTFERAFYDHNSTAQYVPDTTENYTAAGTKLYTATLEKSVADLPMVPGCFFDTKPIIAGLEASDRFSFPRSSSREKSADTKLILASYNTFTKIGEVPLSGDFLKQDDSSLAGPGQGDFKFVGYRFRMFADDARARVVTARRDQVAVLKLADLKLPDEGFLTIEAADADKLVAGKKNTVKLRTRDPRISVELADKPGDMAMTANGLEWTPPEDAVGEQTVRFRLSHGGIERTHAVTLMVSREASALPFSADGLRIAPDGKSAVIWTNPNRRDRFGRPSQAPGDDVPRAAVIELPDGKVVAAGSLPFPSDLVAIDKHQIYAVQAGSGVVAAIDRATFGIKKQLTLEGTLDTLQPVLDQWLIVATPQGRRIKYAVPDLTLVMDFQSAVASPNDPSMRMGRSEGRRAGLRTVAGGGWAFDDGDVFDARFERPLLLRQTPSFISLNPVNAGFPPEMQQQQQQIMPGSRMMPGMGGEGSKNIVAVANVATPPAMVALTHSLRNEQVPGAIHTSRNIETFSLEIYDPARLDVVKRSIPLSRGSNNRQNSGGGEQASRGALIVQDGVAYCAFNGRLARLPLVSDAAASADAPPAFELKQAAVAVDRLGSAKLTHSVTGGKQPYQFALLAPSTGLEISPTDGTVTVDGPKVVEAAIDALVGSTGGITASGRNAPNYLTSPDGVEAYMSRNIANFKQLTGREPTGVPVALVIAVQATDSTPRTARLTYQTLIELPRDKIDERIKKIAEARVAMAASQPAQAPSGAAGGAVGGDAEVRIRQLEQRITALEAQLNILTKLLSGGR
jgi:hypothetical protein